MLSLTAAFAVCIGIYLCISYLPYGQAPSSYGDGSNQPSFRSGEAQAGMGDVVREDSTNTVSTVSEGAIHKMAPGRVGVVVLDWGFRPVEGAEIVMSEAADASGPAKSLNVHTNRDGRAVLEMALDVGAYFAAKSSSGRSGYKWALSADPEIMQVIELQLLEDDFVLTGEVAVGSSDRCVPNACVHIKERRVWRTDCAPIRFDEAPDWKEIQCDAEGRFEVRLCSARGPYEAIAQGLGRTSRSCVILVDDPSRRGSVKLELPGGASLDGLVLDFAGNPAPDCEVAVTKYSMGDQMSTALKTDADGRFTAWFFGGGPCTVTVLGNSSVACGSATSIEVKRGESVRVNLTTREPSMLYGVVINEPVGSSIKMLVLPQNESRAFSKDIILGNDSRGFHVGGFVRGWTYDVLMYRGEEYVGLVEWQAGGGRLTVDMSNLMQR